MFRRHFWSEKSSTIKTLLIIGIISNVFNAKTGIKDDADIQVSIIYLLDIINHNVLTDSHQMRNWNTDIFDNNKFSFCISVFLDYKSCVLDSMGTRWEMYRYLNNVSFYFWVRNLGLRTFFDVKLILVGIKRSLIDFPSTFKGKLSKIIKIYNKLNNFIIIFIICQRHKIIL